MGLFDMFKKKAEPAAAAAPASISASAGADVLCSPVKGKVIKMADVPDPVFGGEVLGKGCAVWPEDDLVYAPCDGKVTVTMGHAVGLQSDSGIEVLVPDGAQRDFIEKVLWEETNFGIVNPDSVKAFEEIAQSLIDRGAQGVILGCTEIGMLLKQENTDTPLFDTTIIHSDAIARRCMEE